MPIQIGPNGTNVKLGPTKPISHEQASALAQEGERLMDYFTAIDQSSIDLDRAPGKVKFHSHDAEFPTVTIAEFSGSSVRQGRLAFNLDRRQEVLDRTYEFDGDNNSVIVTDQLPSFHKGEQNVYRIKNGYEGTVQHVTYDDRR